MNIYLFSGYAGTGKSYTTALCQSLFPSSKRTAFAKRVKDDVSKLYSIPRQLCDTQDGKKTYVTTSRGDFTVRELMIEFSAHAKQITQNPGIWADYVVEEIQKDPETNTWVIEDWRYKQEYNSLKTAFPSARIHRFRVHRPDIIPSSDPSEHDLDDELMDYDIFNTGTAKDLLQLLQMYKS